MKILEKSLEIRRQLDTDAIIPQGAVSNTSDPGLLAKHCMRRTILIYKKNEAGDIIIADRNFGCGSSREHAPLAIKAAGISCVIAKSFARIFYRNSFNMGLPSFESSEVVENTFEGDEIEVDATTGEIVNITRKNKFKANRFFVMLQVIASGGLMDYAQEKQKRKE